MATTYGSCWKCLCNLMVPDSVCKSDWKFAANVVGRSEDLIFRQASSKHGQLPKTDCFEMFGGILFQDFVCIKGCHEVPKS